MVLTQDSLDLIFCINCLLKGSELDSMDQRRYIDPGNYLDIQELLSTFTSEIDRGKVKLEGLIGQGKSNSKSINKSQGND